MSTYLPSPKGFPLLGNLLSLSPDTIFSTLCNWADEYGDRYYFKIGRQKVFVTSSYEDIVKILKDRPDGFRRWSKLEKLAIESTVDGIFIAEGDKWKKHREIVMSTFGTKHIGLFWHNLNSITQKLYDHLLLEEETKKPVDMSLYCMKYATDIVVSFAFGYNLCGLDDKEGEVNKNLATLLKGAARRQSSLFPYWRYFKLPFDKKFDKSLDYISSMSEKIIMKARQDINENKDIINNPRHLLDAALIAQQENDNFSDSEVLGTVLTFLLGGEDTTANTISWIIYYLASNMEIQKKLQYELDIVLQENLFIKDIEHVKQCKYLGYIAEETMRLKPVLPFTALEANKDITINDNLSFKKNDVVFALTGYLGRSEKQFKDVSSFIPERWSDNTPFATDNLKCSIPFGLGARVCPGQRLAKLEIYSAISAIFKNFIVTLDDRGLPIEEKYTFTLSPSHLKVYLKKR